jgi:hypothetical protein
MGEGGTSMGHNAALTGFGSVTFNELIEVDEEVCVVVRNFQLFAVLPADTMLNSYAVWTVPPADTV